MTKLAVSIMVSSLDQARAQAALAAERGADLVEYRLDLFTQDPQAVRELIEGSPLPCIVTCRPTWEGGDYEGDEETRIDLLVQAGQAQPAYIDIELAAWQRSPSLRQRISQVIDHPGQVHNGPATGLILSSHDFDRRPADLLQRVEAMLHAPACRVSKLAWRARSLRDNLETFELLLSQHKPTIALCMGEFGQMSRVLARKFDALLTFAGLDDATVTAPGQVGVATLKNLYRWDRLDPLTQVFGVIGWPVAHSMSPALHNAGFQAVDYNGVYLPLPIPPEYEHFKASVGALLDFAPLHFRGASVTIPHKENLLRFVAEHDGQIEPLAQDIGAANTLTVRDDGSLYASNTDYAAALDAVCDTMGIEREELKDRTVAVIGAGGAARAVVAGFARYGATLTVYNRTEKKARALAEQFTSPTGPVQVAPLDALAASDAQVYINCTPIGMHPNVDATPLPEPPASWGPGTVVFDTIYNPLETKLLQQARQAGCATVPGLEMFTRQAAAQFHLWTNQQAPLEQLRQIVETRLREG